MSRTYKYPRESLDDSVNRKEVNADLRMKRKLEQQRQQRKRKVQLSRSFIKFISFRDKQRARV